MTSGFTGRHRARWLAAACVAAWLMTGCGGGDDSTTTSGAASGGGQGSAGGSTPPTTPALSALDACNVTGPVRSFLDARFTHTADFLRNAPEQAG
mgnify:CR=1 FL=1